jgi:hypothetical protein
MIYRPNLAKDLYVEGGMANALGVFHGSHYLDAIADTFASKFGCSLLIWGFFIAETSSAVLEMGILQVARDIEYVSDPISPFYGFRAPKSIVELFSLFAFLCVTMISGIHPQALTSDLGSIVQSDPCS